MNTDYPATATDNAALQQPAPLPLQPKKKPKAKLDESRKRRLQLKKLSGEELLEGVREGAHEGVREDSLEMIAEVISMRRFNLLFRL